MIIRFPQERCSWPVKQTEPCLILILPVVRIEYADSRRGCRRRHRTDPIAPLTDEERKAWLMDWGTF